MKPSRWALLRLAAAVGVLLAPILVFAVASDREAVKRPLTSTLPYAPGPEEGEGVASLESYMADRLTYPTGRFDSRWLARARRQAALIKEGIPAGGRTSDAQRTTLALSGTTFTELGPKPQQSTGCQPTCFQFVYVSGRVNTITIEPPSMTTPNGQRTAYFGSDGGGIWKSTNCCNTATTWTVTTDGPGISSTSIDDIAIDPNNPNVVYAATGDVSFGSFAFGSSGILKSTNKAGSWSSLATDKFTRLYPSPGYPQYQAVTKIRVDPNSCAAPCTAPAASQKLVAGTKTGLFFSYDAGQTWTGPCLTNGFTSQRQDITDLILTDNGTAAVQGETTTIYAAVGARGYGTTVQPNLGLNGANGIYKTTMPASGCPATWTPLTSGWPIGTAGGVGCDPPFGDSSSLCAVIRDLIPNGGFEDRCATPGPPCQWSGVGDSGFFRDAIVKRTGAAGARIVDATSPGEAQSACAAAPAPDAFDVNFWYRTSNTAVSSISLKTLFFSDGTCTNSTGDSTLTVAAPVTDDAWHQAKGTLNLPAGTGSLRGRLSFTCTGGNCGSNPIVYFDDVSVDRANKLGRIEMAVAPSTLNDGNPSNDVLYAEVQAIDPHLRCGALQVLGISSSRGCFLGLWRSSDSGATWTQRAGPEKLNPETSPDAGPCGEDTPQNWYNEGIAVAPNDPNVLLMDTIDIWRSTDGGNTLVNISCGYHTGLATAPIHVDNHVLTYVPGDPTTVLAGSDGGIYVANDAAAANTVAATPTTIGVPTFQDANLSVATIEFYSGDISGFFATATPTVFAVGGAQDNGSSTGEWQQGSQGPTVWSQRIGGDGMFARIEPQQGQRVFMESQNGALQRSTNGPAGPYSAWAGGWTSDRRSFVFPYEIDKNDCRTFVGRIPETTCKHMIAGSYRVWETIDNGGANTTWYPNSPDLTKCNSPDPLTPCTTGLMDRAFINQLTYAWSDNRVALAGTNDGNVWYGFGMGQGTQNSATWVNVTGGNAAPPAGLPNRPVQDVAIHPDNPLVAWAALGGFDANTPGAPGHVFQVTCTADCATFTWANKTGNLPDMPVNTVIANPKRPNQVFAGTDWGLFFTNDITAASPVWTHWVNGLPNVMIWDMAIDRGSTTLALFTRSRGVFAALLAAAPIPTGVKVQSFSATRAGRDVTVRWRTGAEARVAGFNVWRESRGGKVRVNPKLVAARGGGTRGADYRLVDRHVRAGIAYTYRLEVVGTDGSRRSMGRAAVTVRR